MLCSIYYSTFIIYLLDMSIDSSLDDNIQFDTYYNDSIIESIPINNEISKANEIIDSLYLKYKNNSYMSAKTHHYICNQLPLILDNIQRVHDQRVSRIEELTNDQDNFIQSFLNNNQYFYVNSTEKFFVYDGIHYQTYNEDDILYHVLSSISKDRQLISWKQRTKINIMKRIKENSLLKSIPESDTIQSVIDSLCISVFSKRVEAKYFLTILGDNILKKNTNQIHYINSSAKHFIRELNNICQMLIGQNLSQTFKHKYKDHSYENCRLVKINECIKSESIWYPIINISALDIICVACHYSIRYGSSDDYVLYSSNDEELNKNVFYLKTLQPVQLVDLFINEYLDLDLANSPVVSSSIISLLEPEFEINIYERTTQITWKNMLYLWKQFLDSKNLPSVIFLHVLKGLFIDKLTDYYKENHDSFIGICSKQLPAIQKFLSFWNDTIIMDENEMDLEIDELVLLFRRWCVLNNEMVSTLTDKKILDLIAYFYPNIETDRDKYILKIRCSLWDKQLDIQVALDHLKEITRAKHCSNYCVNSNQFMISRSRSNDSINRSLSNASPSLNNRNITIYDAYQFYCKYYSSTSHSGESTRQIVSKSYFDKYVMDNLSEYVIEDKFLSAEWYMI